MLDTIALAASDSLLMFFVFNFIVVAVIFGSKPRSGFDQESESPLCALSNLYAYTYSSLKQNTDTSKELDIKDIYDSSGYSGELGAPSDSDSSSDDFSSDGDGSGASSNSESSSDDSGEEDDELRRRVEEFIARVNRGWQAELTGDNISHGLYATFLT